MPSLRIELTVTLLAEQPAAGERRREMDAIRHRPEETATRRKRLVRTLELTDDADGELTRDVSLRLREVRRDLPGRKHR